jgi:hypothetical protein
MAVFANIDLEPIVQVDDKTRIDATKSFQAKGASGALETVEIEPETGAGLIDVTGSTNKDWFLDWQYASPGTKTVTVVITEDGNANTFTKDIEVLSEADDALFSKDTDLINLEPEILNYVRPGRSSFLDFHRSAQIRIVDSLNAQGYATSEGARLTKEDIAGEDVKEWSKFLTLALIFEDNSNAIDDIFAEKAKRYMQKAEGARQRLVIRYDVDQDGETENTEGALQFQGKLTRR